MIPGLERQAASALAYRFRQLQILAKSVADSCEFMGVGLLG